MSSISLKEIAANSLQEIRKKDNDSGVNGDNVSISNRSNRSGSSRRSVTWSKEFDGSSDLDKSRTSRGSPRLARKKGPTLSPHPKMRSLPPVQDIPAPLGPRRFGSEPITTLQKKEELDREQDYNFADDTRVSGRFDEASSKSLSYSESARDKVRHYFEKSALADLKVEFPMFEHEELCLGRHLGRGGFSDVEEVRGIKADMFANFAPRRSNSAAPDNKESRQFMAEHCLRPGGDARYAIKRLKRNLSANPKRFWEGIVDLAIEVRFLSVLEHPHIIKLRATSCYDQCSPEYFLILDRLHDTLRVRIAGAWADKDRALGRLGTRIMDRKGLARDDFLEERLSYAYDLSTALLYLHQRRFLHRDLKPENIGFDCHGDIKIFDFGTSRDISEKAPTEEGTYQLSRMTGTLRYMAPEVAFGYTYNEHADVYSFTIILYEMIALERAYEKMNTENKFLKQVFVGGARPRTKRFWKRPIKRLLQQGWHKEQHQRLSTKELSLALRSLVVSLRGGDDSGMDDIRRRSTFIFEKRHIPSSPSFEKLEIEIDAIDASEEMSATGRTSGRTARTEPLDKFDDIFPDA